MRFSGRCQPAEAAISASLQVVLPYCTHLLTVTSSTLRLRAAKAPELALAAAPAASSSANSKTSPSMTSLQISQ